MKDFVRSSTVKLIKLTANHKVAFYTLAAILIPVCVAIEVCTEHLPELWVSIKDNFATLEEQRQYVLGNPNGK